MATTRALPGPRGSALAGNERTYQHDRVGFLRRCQQQYGDVFRLDAGTVPVAGVAWAQGRGIRAVEVQVDGGPWQQVTLLPVPSVDTWVQWRYDWAATPGSHTLSVRATDGTGAVQPEARATPFPDGATGWHTITVSAG